MAGDDCGVGNGIDGVNGARAAKRSKQCSRHVAPGPFHRPQAGFETAQNDIINAIHAYALYARASI